MRKRQGAYELGSDCNNAGVRSGTLGTGETEKGNGMKKQKVTWENAVAGETIGHDKVQGKPTLGPWEAHISRWPNGKLSGKPYVYAPNGPDTYRHVCEPCLDEDGPAYIVRMQEANARLIAAAPELLSALKDCIESLERLGAFRVTCIQQAKAAIKKAEGQP